MNSAASWTRWIWGTRPLRTLGRAAVLGAVAAVVFSGPARPVRVVGESMEPTLGSGSFRWANLWRYRARAPRAGEMVLVRIGRGRIMYLKRVLAVPGETLAFDRGRLVINGEERPEPYVQYEGLWTSRAYTLKEDEFFVAGDNRAMPMEAHATGVADRRRIAGGLWGL
jgi:signal peptidase I